MQPVLFYMPIQKDGKINPHVHFKADCLNNFLFFFLRLRKNPNLCNVALRFVFGVLLGGVKRRTSRPNTRAARRENTSGSYAASAKKSDGSVLHNLFVIVCCIKTS